MSELTDLFWSGHQPLTAATIVQGHISRVRQLLMAGTKRGAEQQPVAWTGQTYQLQSTYQLDSTAFADLARLGDAAAGGTPDRACDFYRRALELWRGEVLIDLDLLQEHPSAVRLTMQRSEVIVRYADAAALTGALAEVLPYLRDACAAEPLGEDVHARLITALAGSGRRAEAIGVFRQLQVRLDRELGIRPCKLAWQAYELVLTL